MTLSFSLFMLIIILSDSQSLDNPYYISPNRFSYTKAELFCSLQCSSHLASIHSETDYNHSLNMINNADITIFPNNDIWIGLNDIDNEGIYQWFDNTTFNFGSNISGGIFPWKQNSPNNANSNNGGQNCIQYAFYWEYLLDDTECDNIDRILCNKCDGIINKYIIINDAMYWDEAETYCNDIGTNLASIHSQSDYNEAIFLCSQYEDNNDCWIGLDAVSTDIDMNDTVESADVAALIDGEWKLVDSDETERYFLCNMPSELCYKQQWMMMNDGEWDWNQNDCDWINNDSDAMSIIDGKQWVNTNGILVIEYMFRIIDIMNDRNGSLGILIFNQHSVCNAYYIGILYMENGDFYVFLSEWTNGEIILLQQEVLLDYTLHEFYLLRVEIINHRMYHVLVNNMEYIEYIIVDGMDDVIDYRLSGYIGIWHINLTTDAKSLYISGSKISMENVERRAIAECKINNDEKLNTDNNAAWGFVLAFIIIVFAYCFAILCVCLICPWREDNWIRTKLLNRDESYSQIL